MMKWYVAFFDLEANTKMQSINRSHFQVFNEPTEAFYQILQENNATTIQLPTKKSTKDPPVPFSTMVEQEELDRLDKSLREVNRQIQKERQRAEAITEEAAMYK